MGTVLTHLPRNAVYAQPVWEIRQETGRYLAPMWQESNFWQASLHCLLAASRYASYLGNFARMLSWGLMCTQRGCTPLHHQSSFSCRVLIRERFSTPNRMSGHDTGVKTWSQAVWGAMAWHGGTEGQPASHPSTAPGCPSLHPDLTPLVLPSRAPCAPPSQYPYRCQQMPSAICSHLKPLQRGVTQTGPGACGRWAQWEPGQARERYSQVCPGRAGTARLYHNIQVFLLPALSLAVKPELEHKRSNLQQEKNKKESKRKEPRWALQHPTACHSHRPSSCSLFSSQSEPMPLPIPRKTFCSALKAKANTWPARGSSLFSSWSLF